MFMLHTLKQLEAPTHNYILVEKGHILNFTREYDLLVYKQLWQSYKAQVPIFIYTYIITT